MHRHVFRRGDRGPAVAEVRERLHHLGLLADPGGDELDAACDSAIRAFQQRRGLRVDGMVGPETYRALDEARWSLGDRLLFFAPAHPFVGDDVLALQQRLQQLGFDPGRCDGILGRRTDEALREFQRNVGLTPDGTFGPTTIRAMAALRRSVVGGRPAALREHEALHRAGWSLTGKVVIVDPGHGDGDTGWVAHGLTEAEVAYDIAARLEGRFAASGAHAFLTRAPDGNPEEADRIAFANAAEADVYVAVHVDGSDSPAPHGLATYYWHDSALGERLAELTQHEIAARTDLLDCRTHPKSWELLRLTRMPAVQVEVGYLTNPHDAARLADPAFRDTVAEAVYAAVQRLYLPADADPGAGQLRLPA